MSFSVAPAKIWMNGRLVEWADAGKIHVASHVIHYGSGVFEGARCYDTPQGSACLRLDTYRRIEAALRLGKGVPRMPNSPMHRRNWNAASSRRFVPTASSPLHASTSSIAAIDALGVNRCPCPVDVAISYGSGARIWHRSAGQRGGRLRQLVDRMAPNTFPYASQGQRQLRQRAARPRESSEVNGHTEGMALDVFGYVSEGSGENMFVVRDGTLYTPPLSASILPGITRDIVVTIARSGLWRARGEHPA